MNNNDYVQRYKQCGKILVRESKLGICPKCADKDKRGIAGGAGALFLAAGAVKLAWKPVKGLLKVVFRR